MYGSIVLCTQNLAVSGANQVLLNLLRGRFLQGSVVVVSPVAGPLDRVFNDCGAAVYIGSLPDVLISIRDIRIVICNTVMTAHIVLELSERKIPHFWILHEWWTKDMLDTELANRKIGNMNSSTFTKALSTCDHVVCVCESQRRIYDIQCPSSVVYVGVPDSRSLSEPRKPRQEVRFLCMGIICPRKNQLRLVEMFKRFARGRKDVHLDIVGARYVRDYEISYIEKVEAAAAYCPYISIHEVTNDPYSFYEASDVLVLCSQNEVTPLVIPEAMLSALPVITTRIAGIPEMLTNDVHGFVLDPGDDEKFIESMTKLADSPDLRSTMGQAARQHASNRFTLDTMVNNYSRLARSLAPITVLVDMDGVLVDWDGGFRAIWRDRSPINRFKSYIMQECVPLPFKPEATAISREPGFFASLPPYPNAIESVKHLAKVPGIRVLILTAPLLANPTCVQDKMSWISEHFGSEWLERLVFARDKTTVRGDVLIDDKPDASEGAQHPTWLHAVFDQPYNAHLSRDRFPYRMSTWETPEWKSMLVNLLSDVGHRICHEDLHPTPLPDWGDRNKEYRAKYGQWRQGGASGCSDDQLSRKRTELEDTLMTDHVLKNCDFDEIHLFREGYRQWRTGQANGARNTLSLVL